MLLLNLEVTPRDAMMLLDLEVTSWGPDGTVRPSPLSLSRWTPFSGSPALCGDGGTCLAHVRGAPCSQALVGRVGCWEWVPFLESANRCCRNQNAERGFFEGALGGSWRVGSTRNVIHGME